MKLCVNRQRAFDLLGTCRTGALFMKMGAKKIETALEYVKSQQYKVEYIVWIAPAAFLSTSFYKKEIKKWSRGLERKIYFFSIEAISSSDMQYLDLHNLIDKFRTFCVVDESITIKNTEAGRTQRLLRIAKKFKFRMILSSKPLTQGLIDLYSQISFMNPNILNMTESQFASNFLSVSFDNDNTRRMWSKPENEVKLIELMRPYIYECDLDFDCSIKYHDLELELTQKEKDCYQQEKEEFINENERIAFMSVVQRFQHIYTISKNKSLALLELIDMIRKRSEKAIIYVKFIDEIVFLKECKMLNFKFVELTGDVNKNKVIKTFAEEADIMFSTYGAGGYGLSLPFCNNIIFYSQTFDYKDKAYCLDCVYKKGVTKELNVYNFWMDTGLEKLIRNSLNKKEHVFSNVCNYISKEELLYL